MNNVDKQYLDIARDILENGYRKKTRAGEVLSVFDRTMRFDLKEGLPLLTTKKVFTKGCIYELLWFLSGDTNIKFLVDHNVNIWTDDAYRYYKELVAKHNAVVSKTPMQDFYEQNPIEALDKEAFIAAVKEKRTELFILDENSYIMSFIPNSYAMKYTYGDLGPVYGHQWRANDVNDCNRFSTARFDQIQNIIDTLRNNPDDRRLLCVAYNTNDLHSCYGMALPPCHVMFQVWSRELRLSERIAWYNMQNPGKNLPEDASEEWVDRLGIEKRELSLSFIMRSNDLPLGNPINIVSYSVLLYMMCKIVNMVPGEVVYHGEDVHIYTNQIDGIKEQLTRKGSDILPKLKFTPGKEFKELSDFTYEDFIIEDYYPDPIIKFPLSVG
jgi:thymidylate synthase